VTAALPELAAVSWRRPMDAPRLRACGRAWTATTVGHTVPLLGAAALLLFLNPLTFPIAAILLAHAWAIPELYANRGAKVVKPRRRAGDGPERTALGLLGDLVGHEARALHARTGLVLERGALGVWLVGEAGALLVRGRRVHCWCVHPASAPGAAVSAIGPGASSPASPRDADLPSADRIAHLLLALREDEQGFATVANHAFAGAGWRVRRRLAREMRPALAAARVAARTSGHLGEPAL
jgi:hypothetical protein